MMADTAVPAVRSLLAPPELAEPGINKMHLHRPGEVVILSLRQWYLALGVANIAGWSPAGTDAPAYRPAGSPFDPTDRAAGSYWPALSQSVGAADASALGRGLAAASLSLPHVSAHHVGPSVLHPLLAERQSSAGAPAYVLGPARADDLHRPGHVLDTLADFCTRGAFTVRPGLPPSTWSA